MFFTHQQHFVLFHFLFFNLHYKKTNYKVTPQKCRKILKSYILVQSGAAFVCTYSTVQYKNTPKNTHKQKLLMSELRISELLLLPLFGKMWKCARSITFGLFEQVQGKCFYSACRIFPQHITRKPLSAWSPSLNTKENACQVLKEIMYLHLKIH